MAYAVLLVAADDPQGRPEGSVADAQILKEGQTCSSDRIEMSSEELDALRATHADAVAVWVAAQRLQRTKTLRSVDLKGEVTRLIESRYSDAQQRSLLMLYQEAAMLNYPNRQQQIQGVLDWIKSVIAQYYVARTQIAGATTAEQVAAIQLDAAVLLASDPDVSLESVMLVND